MRVGPCASAAFLTKPINPVVLAAVVRTRSALSGSPALARTDGLTGLLSHTASKAA